jgi:hypothetical protein
LSSTTAGINTLLGTHCNNLTSVFLFSEWTEFFLIDKDICGVTLFFTNFYGGKGFNFESELIYGNNATLIIRTNSSIGVFGLSNRLDYQI